MPIHNIFIINRAGSLIFDFDNSKSIGTTASSGEIELTFESYPIDFKLDLLDNRLTVIFGQRDGVKVGYVVVALNNEIIVSGGKSDKSNLNVLKILNDPTSYPLTLKFSKPQLNTNEKIILSSMFHSLHAIAAQLSPVAGSSGIESLDTDSYRLQCYQTMTGLKLVVIADQNSAPYLDQFLKKLHELYADFALKNPFYSLEMPIRCELFDQNVKMLLDRFEKSGVIYV